MGILDRLYGRRSYVDRPVPDYLKERFAQTEFVVEGDSFRCWKIWTQELKRSEASWIQKNPGYVICVGELAGMPVNINVFWNNINGHMVMFYEDISQVVDHRMIKEYLDKHCNPKYDGGRQARVDENNFGTCIHYCEGR
jgi:hypothetical protein